MIDRLPAVSFLPTSAVLEMTWACNHRCIFCSCPWEREDALALPRPPEMSVSWWKNLCTRLVKMGVQDFAFTGGEPLLKKGLAEIIAHTASLEGPRIRSVDGALVQEEGRPEIFLLSNGRIMDQAHIDLCAKHGVQLSISLPGLTTFAEHTGGGDPDLVLRWFGVAHAAGVITTAGITVTRRNLFELERTIATALVAGADRILLNRFLPGGRGLSYAKDLALSPDEVLQALDIAEKVLASANRFGNVGTEIPRCLVDPERYPHLSVGNGCAAARSFFVVGPAGRIRVCNHSPVELCHADDLDDPKRGLRQDPYWRRFALGDYQPSACKSCSQISRCAAGCRECAHFVTGDVRAPDPLMLPVPME